ncbi:unnamed protein product, partial [Adineta steineri]
TVLSVFKYTFLAFGIVLLITVIALVTIYQYKKNLTVIVVESEPTVDETTPLISE